MKVVLIGGSASSTPALIDYLAGVPCLPPMEIALMGRSAVNLERVTRASRLLAEGLPIKVTWRHTGDPSWDCEFVSADVIVLQARVGGLDGRVFSETFPPNYGICGDQGLGPGGLASAWWSWPILEKYFLRANVLASGSTFVVLSSPMGILVRLGRRVAPN